MEPPRLDLMMNKIIKDHNLEMDPLDGSEMRELAIFEFLDAVFTKMDDVLGRMNGKRKGEG